MKKTEYISAKTNYINLSRFARCIDKTATSERHFVAFWGTVRNDQAWELLASIHAEIEPKIQALRERQEVLESIGTRVNGGF